MDIKHITELSLQNNKLPNTSIFGVMFEQIHELGLTTSDVPQSSDFIFLEDIGEGGVSHFHSAMERKSGAKCGIKKTSKQLLKDYISKSNMQDTNALFHKEISMHKLQNHPNIVKLYGAFEDAENYYLILELGDQDMYHRVTHNNQRNVYFTEAQALRYIKMGALGIKAIHDTGVIHKDIKIENFIYFKDTDMIKICDFGFAEHINSPCYNFVGTPQYISPEARYGYASEKSDVFSLGITLYILTHGQYPADTQYKFYPYITQEIRKLMKSMWEPNPIHRISIQEVLENPLISGIEL